jgi:DNA-binding transcriptional ArsR family regulator
MDTLLGLPQAAEKLGITRRRAGELVRAGVIPATRIADRWFVQEGVLEKFAESFRPLPPSNRRRPPIRSERTRLAIAQLLSDWQDATADELAVPLDLHPGNVRKHLVIMEAADLVSRDRQGVWRLTPVGHDRYPASSTHEAHRAS